MNMQLLKRKTCHSDNLTASAESRGEFHDMHRISALSSVLVNLYN